MFDVTLNFNYKEALKMNIDGRCLQGEKSYRNCTLVAFLCHLNHLRPPKKKFKNIAGFNRQEKYFFFNPTPLRNTGSVSHLIQFTFRKPFWYSGISDWSKSANLDFSKKKMRIVLRVTQIFNSCHRQ